MAEKYLRDIRVVVSVLPFKVNNYVIDELIDWSAVPEDPIFRLTFPHRDMLPTATYQKIARLVDAHASRSELVAAAKDARWGLNPHPGGQLESNVPILEGAVVNGLQHKYTETVLVFPSHGQTCHAYCGYCFRWAQFVGMDELHQALREPARAAAYLEAHPQVTDVLFTGGDPMIMRSEVLRRYIEPLLTEGLGRVRTLRFGTKVLSYWPYRFTTDPDADEVLRLFEQIVAAGRHVAVMAHFSHPRELESIAVRQAIRRVRDTGAVIRAQAPLVAHVNDDPTAWAAMWQTQVELGVIPYYMFVERDTGAHNYFKTTLARALDIYTTAVRSVSGLARTARGPVMAAAPGKVLIDGVAEVDGERVFSLRFLQSRHPGQVGRTFFAAYDPTAEWWDDLVPALGSRFTHIGGLN
jgi:L-lysine 2,3-aminomutase